LESLFQGSPISSIKIILTRKECNVVPTSSQAIFALPLCFSVVNFSDNREKDGAVRGKEIKNSLKRTT